MPLLVDAYGAENLFCLAYDRFDAFDAGLENSGRALLDRLGVKYVEGDLVSGRGLDKLPRAPRMIFHLASNTVTGSNDHTVNDRGTRNLLEALGPFPPDFHIIFTSTIAVSDHRRDPATPVNEDTELLRPFNDYGRRKLEAEKYLRAQAAICGWRVTIIRLSAIYGLGNRPGGLYDMMARLSAKNSILARLNYPGLLSILNVDDIAYILQEMSRRQLPAGATELYIPVGETIRVADLARLYYEAQGKPYRAINLPSLFWSFCHLVAQLAFRLEPVLPHSVMNRFWQADLVVGTGFANASDKIYKALPGLTLRKFRDVLPSMIGR
jgi:nucleoside-diphosphate-sugar epimerase